MTVRLPGFTWRALPEAEQQPAIIPTQGILHTVVGHADPYGHFSTVENKTESHAWVPMDPTDMPQQYISLSRSADANYLANRRPDGTGAISIESQDYGPATIQETPWTEFQVQTFARLMMWCAAPEGLVAAFQAVTGITIAPIPIVRCATPTSPGWGYHSMWPKPNPWTVYQGKSCPGRARIAQFDGILDLARSMVAVAGTPSTTPPEEDMPYLLLHDPVTGAIYALFPGGRREHIGGAEWTFYKGQNVPMVDVGGDEAHLLANP